jgi:hypothetical protein
VASRKHQGGGETIALNRSVTPVRARLIEGLVDELRLLLHLELAEATHTTPACLADLPNER